MKYKLHRARPGGDEMNNDHANQSMLPPSAAVVMGIGTRQ